MNSYSRLIEDFIPIKEISAESAREKSIRKGHISTLHLWWARRPLVAARAAVFAALVDAPETPQKRTALKKLMIDLCKWEASETTIDKAKKAILEAQRTRLGLPENTPLKDVLPPKVLDMFAGGGAIPLESLRLGCETYAIDLNPVAHIIELCTLVYPQKYGQKLASEVEKWGNWVIENVRHEIGDLYPKPSPSLSQGRGTGGEGDKLAGKQRNIPRILLERARELRQKQTPAEEILWECVRNRQLSGAKFRRQHNIGSYIADFYCHEARLIVELDGAIHNKQQAYDHNRDNWLQEQGFKVIRFPNSEIFENLELVLSQIATYLPDTNPVEIEQTSLFNSPLLPKEKGQGDEGLTPVAYLWTRTVKCPNPACNASVPLVRQTWLCKKNKKYVALKVIPNHQTKKVEFEVVESTTEKGLGFNPAAGSSRGNSTCRHCGTTVDVNYVKAEGKAGRIEHQLMSIVCTKDGEQGKTYLSATDYQKYIPDKSAIQQRLEKLCHETGLTTPDEPLPNYGVLGFRVQPYGLVKWSHLFTPRQLLSLMTFVKWVRKAHEEMLQQEYDEDLAKAISSYLGILCNRLADRSSTICRWTHQRDMASNTFSRQALPMVWDFTENNPLGNSSGNANNAMDWMLDFLIKELDSGQPAILQRTSSMALPLEKESLDAIITDPPYFDSVPYADLSDFFYVWLKRSIGYLYPEHFSGQLTPKKNEAIMEPSRHGGDKKKAAKVYEEMLHQAFCEANRVLKNDGIMSVVYAHKTTSGWATLIDSLRRAGFTITEAWPLDTESVGRLRAIDSAALASSIFLVARKRTTSIVGDYAMDVQPQLKAIIQERVKTLIAEGVSGADLVIACVGAGLRAYTQYETVELPNGDELDATSFLDEVQKEVAETILKEVLGCDQKGISKVDKPTQYYILGRYEYGESVVEFDEANTLARGVGIELVGANSLTDGRMALVKKDKNQIQLKDYQERGAFEDLGIANGHPATLVDILHRLLWLSEHKPQEVNNYLIQAQLDASQLQLVAQSLCGRSLTPENGHNGNGNGHNGNGHRSTEQQAISTLLASWKRVVEDNLFTRGS